MVDSNNSFEGVDYMIPANDDAMSSIDLFLKTVSNIILESKPKKPSNSEADNDQKKSIKAKKILKTTEVKKVTKVSSSKEKKQKVTEDQAK